MARAPTIVQRISLDGGPELEQLLKRLGTAGQEAFQNIQNSAERASRPLESLRTSLQETGERFKQFGQRTQEIGRSISDIGKTFSLYVTAPIVAGFGLAARSAITFESAMADIRKVVDFPTPEGLDELGTQLRELTRVIPLTADELAAIAANAGQAGVAAEDLAGFTEIVAKATIAFGLSADEAGTALAKIKTALGLSIPDVQTLTDAMNTLANNMAASETEVLDVVGRVAALGEVAGVSAKDVAAIGAAMVSMGVDSERAATGLRNIFLTLTAGGQATEDIRNAFASLGLDAERVAKDIQTKGAGVIVDVLDRIAKKAPEVQAALLNQLFGERVVDAAAPLVKNLDVLRESLGLVADEATFAGSAQREFEVRSKTTANALQLLRNSLDEMAKSFGNLLLPAINAVASGLTSLFFAIASLPDPIKAFILIIGGLAATIGPLLFALGLGIRTFGFFARVIGEGALLIGRNLRVIVGGFNALRIAMVFLFANPVGAVILGIAAAIGVLAFAFGGFDELMKNVAGGISVVLQGLTIVLDVLRQLGLVPDSWVRTIAQAAINLENFATDGASARAAVQGVSSALDQTATSASSAKNELQDAFNDLVAQGFSAEEAIAELNRRLAQTGSADVSGAVASLNQAEAAAYGWRDALMDVWRWLVRVNSAESGGEGKAGGGLIRGPGSSTSDSIPARLSNGEFVIRAAAVRKYGANLFRALNSMRLAAGGMGYAMGGLVSRLNSPMSVPMRFAEGGMVGEGIASDRPFTLVLDGKTFSNLRAPVDTAEDLLRFARSRSVRSAGKKASWYGSQG